MKKKDLLEHIDRDAVVAAIGRAEKLCSGEIRVHIEPNLHGRELWGFARKTFERLGMTRTTDRNGVLLFIAAREQQFAILGDRGIDERVEPGFWEHIVHDLTGRFREGQFTEGLVEAIEEAGARLQEHFPYHREDVDELPNELSIGSRTPPDHDDTSSRT